MEQEVERIKCVGDDASQLTIIEFRYTAVLPGSRGIRILPGARRLALSTGEAVRYIDRDTFEVVCTGELLRRG